MSNEFQLAYELSRSAPVPSDRDKIRGLLARGRFVLSVEHERFCRFTDASLPGVVEYLSDHPSLDEAEKASTLVMDEHGESFLSIQSPRELSLERRAPAPMDDDNIPF
jgi:hypothetical protein